VNTQTTETRDFLYTAEATTSAEETAQVIRRIVGEQQIDALDASVLAVALTGDSIAANLFLVGIASQRGLLPISPKAIERAIEVNGVAVELNQSAFSWGRRFVEQPDKVLALLPQPKNSQLTLLDDIIADREVRLVCYQSEDYAALYVRRIRTVEKRLNHLPDNAALLCDIARQLYRLMALKDEYEVARILTTDDEPDGIPKLNRTGVNFYFAPTLLSQWWSSQGRPKKIRMGAWARFPLKVLAGLKFVRGTAMDVFAYTDERRAERADLTDYLADIDLIAEMTTTGSMGSANQLANAPSKLRGYGHVRAQNRRTWLDQRNRYRAELQLAQPLNVTDVNQRGINGH
jgi:indolepyruvate ferredoxin oxidoreductase